VVTYVGLYAVTKKKAIYLSYNVICMQLKDRQILVLNHPPMSVLARDALLSSSAFVFMPGEKKILDVYYGISSFSSLPAPSVAREKNRPSLTIHSKSGILSPIAPNKPD
jgi:hypothetical protein